MDDLVSKEMPDSETERDVNTLCNLYCVVSCYSVSFCPSEWSAEPSIHIVSWASPRRVTELIGLVRGHCYVSSFLQDSEWQPRLKSYGFLENGQAQWGHRKGLTVTPERINIKQGVNKCVSHCRPASAVFLNLVWHVQAVPQRGKVKNEKLEGLYVKVVKAAANIWLWGRGFETLAWGKAKACLCTCA